MADYTDLEKFFAQKDYKVILVADAEPFVHKKKKDEITVAVPAGGVATAFGPVAKASHALFVARGKTDADKETVDKKGLVQDPTGSYTLKRIFLTKEQMDDYYFGFANQTLWPLCHVAFERPGYSWKWYEGFKAVNEKFAKAIKDEIKGKTLIWLNDYQLSLVPKFLNKPKDTMIGMFWHIPWPTWEVFRTLPQQKEILESLLACDFIGFHRGYQARNFIHCVERELEARVDLETNRIYYNKHVTTVRALPMGIDADTVISLVDKAQPSPLVHSFIRNIFHIRRPTNIVDQLFATKKVLLGIDRLDYTKGLRVRLEAVDKFFAANPQYRGKVTYLSILAPSRQEIPAYAHLKREVLSLANDINKKYGRRNWRPVQVLFGTFSREKVINMYSKAAVCLVTPLDDGMNLVSKEFVAAASVSRKPGMIVLSQFAGSAIDLTRAVIVNPYDTTAMAQAIKQALEMPEKERKDRIHTMTATLQERNVYTWALDFLKDTEQAAKDQRSTT